MNQYSAFVYFVSIYTLVGRSFVLEGIKSSFIQLMTSAAFSKASARERQQKIVPYKIKGLFSRSLQEHTEHLCYRKTLGLSSMLKSDVQFPQPQADRQLRIDIVVFQFPAVATEPQFILVSLICKVITPLSTVLEWIILSFGCYSECSKELPENLLLKNIISLR